MTPLGITFAPATAAPPATTTAAAGVSAVAAPPPTLGTPATAPATRHGFGASHRGEEELRRTWRVADVMAAISGGPRARLIIEAASRPGPVEPGSLIEAVKALCPAPDLPGSTRTV